MNRKENIMGNEKMTLIYINRDIYSYMLPNKENRLVSAADLLDAWGRAIRRPGELWFDIEKAERDFVRKVFDILAPACATPLKGSGLNVSVIGMTSDDDKKRLLMTLIERVKSIDMARFLEAYRDDGWVYDSENGVAYGPYQWNGLVGGHGQGLPVLRLRRPVVHDPTELLRRCGGPVQITERQALEAGSDHRLAHPLEYWKKGRRCGLT